MNGLVLLLGLIACCLGQLIEPCDAPCTSVAKANLTRCIQDRLVTPLLVSLAQGNSSRTPILSCNQTTALKECVWSFRDVAKCRDVQGFSVPKIADGCDSSSVKPPSACERQTTCNDWSPIVAASFDDVCNKIGEDCLFRNETSPCWCVGITFDCYQLFSHADAGHCRTSDWQGAWRTHKSSLLSAFCKSAASAQMDCHILCSSAPGMRISWWAAAAMSALLVVFLRPHKA
jgi:hypothetical protein